jgi:hypothetical protein
MPELPAIMCAGCGRTVGPVAYVPETKGGPPTASSFDSCLRSCPDCNLGYSNASDPGRAVLIHRDPLQNIPEPVRPGADEALASALNIRNRANKRVKFGFETSEDAVTWTVFRYLQESGELGRVIEACVPALKGIAGAEPAVLFWGAPVPARDERSLAIRARLAALCSSLGENPESFSEPDVILDFGPAGLVIIEVKYRSPNDNKDAGYGGWPRYLDRSGAFVDEETIRTSGHSELARNWRIGWGIASHRPLALVNLAPAGVFDEPHGTRLTRFERALNQTERKCFIRLPWSRLVDPMRNQPPWLEAFIAERELCGRGSGTTQPPRFRTKLAS